MRALIALAGPAAGLLAALVAAALFWHTGNPLWAALAHTGAWLNLLNLIPVWMLDGASAVLPLDTMGRISLLAFSVLLFWWSGQRCCFCWLRALPGSSTASRFPPTARFPCKSTLRRSLAPSPGSSTPRRSQGRKPGRTARCLLFHATPPAFRCRWRAI